MNNRDVEASLNIEMNVECPHCENYFDLLDIELGLNDEGQMISQACPNGLWSELHSEFSEDVDCPSCGKEVNIRGIAW